MFINGIEIKGAKLQAMSKEEILEKLTREDLIQFIDILDEQERHIKQWEKEHNF